MNGEEDATNKLYKW